MRRGTVSLGLGVATDHVSVVCAQGTAILWAETRPRMPDEPLAETLRSALDTVPAARPQDAPPGQRHRRGLPRRRWTAWHRGPITVALGPAAVQVKRLTGLPPLDDPGALTALVRENVQRFFLRNGVPLVTSSVRVASPGVAWAAAFEAPVVEELACACSAAGLGRIRIVPTVVALPRILTGSHARWTDGACRMALDFDGQELDDVRRVDGTTASVDAAPPLASALAALGRRAVLVADAYAATQVPRARLFAWGDSVVAASLLALAPRAPSEMVAPPVWRLAMVAGAFLLAACWALLAGGLANAHMAHQAGAARMAHVYSTHALADSAAVLTRVTATLQAVVAFDAERPPVTLLLTYLTRALPEHAALVAFELDSAGTGTLVAIAPDAQQIVDAVERVPGLASPRIVGPVTPETANGQALERVSLRFQVLPALEPAP